MSPTGARAEGSVTLWTRGAVTACLQCLHSGLTNPNKDLLKETSASGRRLPLWTDFRILGFRSPLGAVGSLSTSLSMVTRNCRHLLPKLLTVGCRGEPAGTVWQEAGVVGNRPGLFVWQGDPDSGHSNRKQN